MSELLLSWSSVLIALVTLVVTIGFAKWRRRRTRRREHDTVSCSQVYILPGVIMWSKLEEGGPVPAELRCGIDTFLQASACGCPRADWFYNASHDADSLFVERSCRTCGRSVSLLLEWPSSTPSNPEVGS